MSVFDATAVDMAAKAGAGVSGAVKEAAPEGQEGAKPSPDGSAAKGAGAEDKGAQAVSNAAGRPETSKEIEAILDKYGLDSPEELKDFLDNLAGLREKLAGEDLEEILQNHKEMQKFRREWARAQREKLKEQETPEQTIERLERELAAIESERMKSAKEQKRAESAKRAVEAYYRTVRQAIQADESIPEDYRPFVEAFMGVESPVNDIDIEDRAAVRKAWKTWGAKMVKDFEQAVIRRYRAGKAEIPKVPPPSGQQAAPLPGEAKPKTLSEARKLAHQSLAALFGRKG
ncbi:MAG: hypothetical protein WHT06_15900 [Desulfobacterales bacterium]